MRILVTHPKAWITGGYSLKGVEVRRVSIGGKMPRRIEGNVTFDGIGEVATAGGLQELCDVFVKFEPDVFMFGIHFNFEHEFVRELRQRHQKTKFVMHFTDQRSTMSKYVKKYVGLLDLLLVTNQDREDHVMYAHKNAIPRVRTFYDGVSPREYWEMPCNPRYDCFFGGNNFFALNTEMMQMRNHPAPWISKFSGAEFRDLFLRQVHSKFNLLIRGLWGWRDTGFNVKPPRFHPFYINALREAKIILNTVNVPRYNLYTRRLFRSIASGRLYLTQYCQGYEDDWVNHKHFCWFNTVEEGLDMIKFYLDNDSERERIARTGRKLILEKHTWKHRLQEFVSLIREIF